MLFEIIPDFSCTFHLFPNGSASTQEYYYKEQKGDTAS